MKSYEEKENEESVMKKICRYIFCIILGLAFTTCTPLEGSIDTVMDLAAGEVEITIYHTGQYNWIQKGTSVKFHASLSGDGKSSIDFTWSLTGQTAPGTWIDSEGKLTVDINEPVGNSLNITGTSVLYPTKSATYYNLNVIGSPLYIQITGGPASTLSPLDNETTTTFTVQVSGFLNSTDANNNVWLIIEDVSGLAFNGTEGSPSGTTRNYTVTVTYNGTEAFYTGSRDIWINGLSNIPDNYSYTGGAKTTTVTIYDGLAATTDRSIRVNQNNITAFNTFANTEAGLTRHYLVTEPITLGTPIGGSNWTPIGSSSYPFTGTFDGGNHAISNLAIAGSSLSDQGFFSVIGTGAIVKNVILSNANVSGLFMVGGVAGINNRGTIQNCSYSGTVTGIGDHANYIGGLVGSNTHGIVEKCYNTGNISGRAQVGGVVGDNDGGTVRYSYNTGSITGEGYVGGVVGTGTGTGLVEYCYNTGNISATETNISCVGGVAGQIVNAVIKDCYNTGGVTGSGSYVGGVGGRFKNSTIQNCYNIGSVIGRFMLGGVIGGPDGVETKMVLNCITMNNSITGTIGAGINYGRIIGEIYGVYLSNNYGRSDMVFYENPGIAATFPGYTSPGSLNDNHGKDIDVTYTAPGNNWWTNSANWNTTDGSAWNFDTVWEWNNSTGLPILRNMPEAANQYHTKP